MEEAYRVGGKESRDGESVESMLKSSDGQRFESSEGEVAVEGGGDVASAVEEETKGVSDGKKQTERKEKR